MNIASIIYREDLYPRFNFDEETVNQYRLNIGQLPSLVVSKNNILIDGYHRLIAYRIEQVEEIPVEVLPITEDEEILKEAIRRNASHGRQLTMSEKKKWARHLYENRLKINEIAEVLAISYDTVNSWLHKERRARKEEEIGRVIHLNSKGYTQQQIADETGIPRRTVSDYLVGTGLQEITPKEFEKLVCDKLNAEHVGKSSNDKGIDGILDGKTAVQVKQGDRVGRPAVDQLVGSVNRARLSHGIIVAKSFSSGAVKEVERLKKEDGLNIELKLARDVITGFGENLNIQKSAKIGEMFQSILDLYLQCKTQNQIATAIGVSEGTVSRIINEIKQDKLSDESPPESLKIFNLWNFGKSNDALKYPGQIPSQIMENLLWYYTNPFDVVYDPMAGGGTTIRVCKAMYRRWQASDIAPIVSEIKCHDITAGFPGWLTKPDFIFLDPPYWDMKKGEYSNDKTNLANMDLEDYYQAIDSIAKSAKQVLRDGGYIAWIVSASQKSDRWIDHAIRFFTIFEKYFTPVLRCDVPYNTQQYTGNNVKTAKENKRLLNLTRDLGVFKKCD